MGHLWIQSGALWTPRGNSIKPQAVQEEIDACPSKRQETWTVKQELHPGALLQTSVLYSQPEGKIGLPRANPRGRLRSPS